MLKTLLARLRQGYRTTKYPEILPALPDRFRGIPVFDRSGCNKECSRCVAACPTNSIQNGANLSIDLGTCVFCAECSSVCPSKSLRFTREFKLAARKREDLIIKGDRLKTLEPLEKKMRSLVGRSLKLRQVSAGGCNACEADINVLSTITWDIGRFGIQVVASPRHADGLLVTGPVTENMKLALQKTYNAVPHPKIVIAIGACAISGGIYRNSPEQNSGVASILPVDLFIPGCPPHPATILDGLLRLTGRI
jgi:Ni,Fe-hydrogenase III small subunit/ferredoxin